MATTVDINGRPVRLLDNMVIGKGGEADIYKLADGASVLKLFKLPGDPDYVGQPNAQEGARQRIKLHQTKLPAFPRGLPGEVVTPTSLAYDRPGHIAGYTMPFIDGMEVLMRLGQRDYRETNHLDGNHVVGVFRKLADVVGGVHNNQVVIGDFSDLNVLVGLDGRLALVDADSMQFDKFFCQTFTSRFVDPLRCATDQLTLAQSHNQESDWYAYFVMLLQSLLYVGPYGGVHRPKTGPRLQHDKRVLKRITVLSPDVIYPKPAISLTTLPDDLLQYMERVFVGNARGRFPLALLDGMRWTKCNACGFVHARAVCPQCQMPGLPKPVMTIRGTVTMTTVFQTEGLILQAEMHDGAVRYLYEENGNVLREGGRVIMTAAEARRNRLRIQRDKTVAANAVSLRMLDASGKETNRYVVGSYRDRLPMFDTNAHTTVWLQNGQLVSEGRHGPTFIGTILDNQTLVWTGETFGLGFYQAGQLTRTFVFRPGIQGINDRVDVGPISGQIVDATCAFSNDRAWLFLAVSDNGTMKHRCYVVDAKGAVLAKAEADQGEDSWLGRSIRGHMAAGTSLLVATDDGIVRVGVTNGAVSVDKTFPDTEPYVDTQTYLVPGPGGIHAVSNKSIKLIVIR